MKMLMEKYCGRHQCNEQVLFVGRTVQFNTDSIDTDVLLFQCILSCGYHSYYEMNRQNVEKYIDTVGGHPSARLSTYPHDE